jgi:FkbM family methyltransferase
MRLIKALKNITIRLGLYNAIRYSKFYYWVLKYKNPKYIYDLNQDLSFYREVLGNSLGLVFDVGANHGDKTWAFSQISKKVVSFEPDTKCFSALSARFMQNKKFYLENIALGDFVGEAVFYVEDDGSAYNTLSEKERDWLISTYNPNIRQIKVQVSTLDKLIVKYGIPDFLKIDVEGGEKEVFNGLSYFVPIICFEANLPRFREETVYIIERFITNERVRFNLRLGNKFVFSTHQPAIEIINKVNQDIEVSYDIFIFN